MNWLKLYHEARTDRKLATLADDEHRVWFNLLLLASEQEQHRGEILGLDLELLALEVSGADTSLLTRTLTKLQRLRIVSIGNAHIKEGNALVTPHIAFLAFSKRQQVKPSDRPERVLERVRRHRNAPGQESNAPVTPKHKSVTPRNAHREEKRREDTEANASVATGTAVAQTQRAQPAGLSNGAASKAERDAMWEAVTAECGDAVMPESKSSRGKVVSRLLAAHYDPAQVHTAAETYRRRYSVDLTDTALAKHIDHMLSTDDPVPHVPVRPSRADTLSKAATEIARRIDDARQRRGTGSDLSALPPQLRRLAP